MTKEEAYLTFFKELLKTDNVVTSPRYVAMFKHLPSHQDFKIHNTGDGLFIEEAKKTIRVSAFIEKGDFPLILTITFSTEIASNAFDLISTLKLRKLLEQVSD